MSYKHEPLQTIHLTERRIRDTQGLCPKRRAEDRTEEPKPKVRCEHVSQRELELLAKIDGHIARIVTERKGA